MNVCSEFEGKKYHQILVIYHEELDDYKTPTQLYFCEFPPSFIRLHQIIVSKLDIKIWKIDRTLSLMKIKQIHPAKHIK